MPFDKSLIDFDLLRRKFFSLTSLRDVADMLEVSERGLRHLLIVVDPQVKYQVFTIPKKSGGERLITAPANQLKYLQKRLLICLENIFKPKICAHGFIPSRNICSNAKRHVASKHVLNIDISDFFPAIHFGRVRGMFMSYPYNLPKDAATVLAQICCHEGQLPQGAPTSPIISNMLCLKLDSQLMKFAGKNRCNYTRYADDLTFSTNQKDFPKNLAVKDKSNQTQIGDELKKIIEKNGFQINSKKVRLQFKSERQEVTGLIINKRLNVSRKYIREIRALFHNWEKYGLDNCEKRYKQKFYQPKHFKVAEENISFEQMVKGKISFLGMVRGLDDSIYLKFLDKFARLSPHLVNSQTKTFLEKLNNYADWILSKSIVVEAESFDGRSNQGTGFFLEGYGLMTCAHIFGEESEIPINSVWKIKVGNRDESIQTSAKVERIDFNLDLAILSTDFKKPHYFEADDKQHFLIDKTEIKLAGFPNHSSSNSGRVVSGKIISKKKFFGNDFYVISVNIIQGNSGGPVFNEENKVIGIAARGASNDTVGYETEFHGFIPVINIKKLL